MPASPQSSGTAGSIVLVEEYGALAAAIASALKKFAPGFAIGTVRSLQEAENAITELKPDLLIVDFDPPQPDALEIFTRLKSRSPGTRVLLIAAAQLSRLADARRAPAAFRFVDKPFDLTALGNGVESVLGARRSGDAAGATLRNLSVTDVIPLQCLGGVTGVLKVDASEGRSGEIHFIAGQISHAETTEADGAEALREMLAWRSPRFKQPKRRPRAARTIQGSWTTVLFDAMTSVDLPNEAAADDEAAKLAGAVGGGKKIVVVDDTDMLLVFVEDSLATADPTLEIVTASTGHEGVSRVSAIQPDLVLLDYSLPDLNGDEVCRRLLDNPLTAAIPVIMMSGHVPEMAASALRFENIVATIAKPFLSEALVDLVTKALADPTQFSVRPPAPRSAPANPAPAAPPPAVSKPSAARPEDSGKHGNGQRRTPSAGARPTEATPAATKSPLPSGTAVSLLTPPQSAPSVPPQPQPSVPSGGAAKQAVVAPPPPMPVIARAPKPVLQRPPTLPLTQPKQVAIAPVPAPKPIVMAPGVAPARLATVSSNAVVVGFALEVLAIQFSPALQMAAIRARPVSRTVSVHVDPSALSGVPLPEAGFELGPINLDARGQIDTLRLIPTAGSIAAVQPRNAFAVGGVSVLPWNDDRALELTPSGAAAMTMHLSASFELAGVELTAAFGVRSLVLKTRGGDIRVSLNRERGETAARFKTAQVLLNRSAHIAEILLDAIA